MNDLDMCRGRIKIRSTIASHSPLNISETVLDVYSSKGPPVENGLWRYKWSRDPEGQIRDRNTLRVQYLKMRCYFSNNRQLL